MHIGTHALNPTVTPTQVQVYFKIRKKIHYLSIPSTGREVNKFYFHLRWSIKSCDVMWFWYLWWLIQGIEPGFYHTSDQRTAKRHFDEHWTHHKTNYKVWFITGSHQFYRKSTTIAFSGISRMTHSCVQCGYPRIGSDCFGLRKVLCVCSNSWRKHGSAWPAKCV